MKGNPDYDDQKLAALAKNVGVTVVSGATAVNSLASIEQLLTQMTMSPSPEGIALAFSLGMNLTNEYPYLARELNQAAYESQVRLQKGTRIHKGSALHQMGYCFTLEGDLQAAFRWTMLAYLEDCWSGSGSTPTTQKAYEVLRTRFSVPSAGLSNLNTIVQNVKAAAPTDEFAKLAELHPELLFVLAWPEVNITAPPGSSTSEYVNWELYRDLLGLMQKKGSKSETGHRAEVLLAVYLSGAVSFEVRSRVWTRTKEYEFDVLASSSLSHPLWHGVGPYFAGECKNWEGNVGAEAVTHFAAKLSFHRMNFGLLLAKNGTSGHDTKAYKNAQKTILKLSHAQQLYVGVWDLAKLQDIEANRIGPLAAIRDLYEHARFELS